MSLLNDMLRDLDARRSRPEGLDALALQGVGPSLARRAPALPLGRLVLGIALAVGLAAGGIQAWSLRAPTLPDTPAPVLPDRALPAEAAASEAHALPVEAPALVTDTQAMAPEPITAPVLPKHAPRPAVAPVPRAEPPARTSPATAAVATVPARDATTYKNIRALAPAEQAQQTFEQGAAALRQGRAERAQALLQETLDLMPTHSQARLALAGLWVRQQRIEPALDLLARGLALEPESIELARLRGHLLLQQGRIQEARRVLESAAPAASEHANYQALLGTLYQRLEQHAQAATHYRRALALQPDQGLWWMGLGVSLEQTKQSVAAREAFHTARGYPLSRALQQYVEGRLAALGH
jgi:MSHA biogenesis protein MshN